MVTRIEELFPGLRGKDWHITSPVDAVYNCIAWAALVTDCWWWPIGEPTQVFWPASAPRQESLAAFIAAFATLGYQVCESDSFEAQFKKVALFSDADHRPTHAARQLPSGRWTSKLGRREDIEHDLHDLEGDAYGNVIVILKRPTAINPSEIA